MSESTSISALKVGMDMQFLASYSTMPGHIPGARLKFVTWADQSLCLLELWHFFLICFTYNLVVTCYYACSLQFWFSLEANVPVYKVWRFKYPLLHFVQ